MSRKLSAAANRTRRITSSLSPPDDDHVLVAAKHEKTRKK